MSIVLDRGERRTSALSRVLTMNLAVIGVLATIAIFFVLPLFVVRFLDTYIASAWLSNTVEGLLRLAILLAYSKTTLYDELLHSDLPEDPGVHSDLPRYFPTLLSQRFVDAMERHRLKE